MRKERPSPLHLGQLFVCEIIGYMEDHRPTSVEYRNSFFAIGTRSRVLTYAGTQYGDSQ
jgi:hypothetical protein